jgi:Arc/MetJ family transcription regulator
MERYGMALAWRRKHQDTGRRWWRVFTRLEGDTEDDGDVVRQKTMRLINIDTKKLHIETHITHEISRKSPEQPVFTCKR